MFRAASTSLRTCFERVVLGAVTLCLGAGVLAQPDEAGHVFFRSIYVSGKVNATLIQTKRVSDDNKSTIKFSVMMNANGFSRRTVLQPLSMEGTILIDDGRTWTTIEPERREATIQPSPLREKMDSKFRTQLIKANYELRSDGESKIAGRKVLMVRAVPKESLMSARRYSIDTENFVLLRIESVGDEGKYDVLMDTLAATFPRDMDPGLFDVDTTGYKVKRTDYPKPIKDLGAARDTLGFAPRIPAVIPFGFRVTQKHLVGGTERQFLALRLSDGLSMVTVYQWDSEQRYPESPFLRTRDGEDDAGVCYKVVGDVPRVIRKKLAETFREVGGNTITWDYTAPQPARALSGPPTAAAEIPSLPSRRLRVAPERPTSPLPPEPPESDRDRGIGIERDPRYDIVLLARRRN